MSTQSASNQGSGLAPNVASLLCYVCTFVTGIVFLVLEKNNKEVRFHAWQAIFFGVAVLGIQIIISVMGAVLGAISYYLAILPTILTPLVWLLFFIFWVICLIKAYNGEHYHLPIIGPLAENQANK